MIRVLIADEHGLYRRGLRVALQRAFPNARVVEVCTLDRTLSTLAAEDNFDVALVDLSMPGVRSIEDLRTICLDYPRTCFVVISSRQSVEDVLESLSVGLHGYICKSQEDGEIMGAISDVLSGRVYVPTWIVQRSSATAMASRGAAPPARRNNNTSNFSRLTPRQRDVLHLISEGLSNREISNRLEISEPTTKVHVTGLMRALNVRNRTEAAAFLNSWRAGAQNQTPTEKD